MSFDMLCALSNLRPGTNAGYLGDIPLQEATGKWPTSTLISYTQGLVRYDEPLPAGFTPPTQAEIDAAIAKLDQPPTPAEKLAAAGLTVADLKSLLGLT